MTASTRYLAARAVALRRQKLSTSLIGRRLGIDRTTVSKYVRELAPELVRAIRAEHTLRWSK